MAEGLQRIEEEQFCVFRGICIFQFLKLSLCRMNEHILFRYSSLIISKLARWAENLKSPLQSRTHRGNILCINMLHWTCCSSGHKSIFLIWLLLCHVECVWMKVWWKCNPSVLKLCQSCRVESLSWEELDAAAAELHWLGCIHYTQLLAATLQLVFLFALLPTGTTIICRVLLLGFAINLPLRDNIFESFTFLTWKNK